MNLKGCYEIYKFFIKSFNEHYNINIEFIDVNIKCYTVKNLFSLNLDSQILNNIADNYYYSDKIELFLLKKKVNEDKSIKFYDYDFNELNNLDVVIDRQVLSNNIIITKNNTDNNISILIFYDSFLISTMTLYMKTFNKCIFIKNIYNLKFVEKYNCDYVVEFRVERFLYC
jgi:hypothetical protein